MNSGTLPRKQVVHLYRRRYLERGVGSPRKRILAEWGETKWNEEGGKTNCASTAHRPRQTTWRGLNIEKLGEAAKNRRDEKTGKMPLHNPTPKLTEARDARKKNRVGEVK